MGSSQGDSESPEAGEHPPADIGCSPAAQHGTNRGTNPLTLDIIPGHRRGTAVYPSVGKQDRRGPPARERPLLFWGAGQMGCRKR